MLEGPLASAYAGQAAQEEDTLGLPSYSQFKRYATFKTDVADFWCARAGSTGRGARVGAPAV